VKLEQFRNTLQSTSKQNSDLFYPHSLTFTDASGSWTVRGRVRDPRKPEVRNLLESLGIGAEYLKDARLMHVHPDDTPPAEGAQAAFDDGTLVVTTYQQKSAYVDQRTAACMFSR